MRVFVVGATGAIGSRLVPQLIDQGHDNEPAPMSEWLPALAAALGAKRPLRVPLWLARLVAGKGTVMMAVGSRGASNAKAKRELGWSPRYPTWRLGFAAAYGQLRGT